MLRSCAFHERLVQAFLARPGAPLQLIAFSQNENFDVSSDAFSSLHDLLLTHKSVAAAYLEANFTEFFELYNVLLQSDDYITQRQALKLLGEILLDRSFMKVMLSYIGDDGFLQIHMNLLRESSKAIKIEAFHVFKIFAANPRKPPRVQQILFKNKDRLMKLLEALQPNKENDKQFDEDRRSVLLKLRALELPARVPSRTTMHAEPGAEASETRGNTPRSKSVAILTEQDAPEIGRSQNCQSCEEHPAVSNRGAVGI